MDHQSLSLSLNKLNRHHCLLLQILVEDGSYCNDNFHDYLEVGEVFDQHEAIDAVSALEVLVPSVLGTLANLLVRSRNDFLVSLVGDSGSLLFQVVLT